MMLVFVSTHLPTMFDFLFKRSPKKPAAPAPVPAVTAQANKQQEAQQRKQAALQQLESLVGNEAALADFLLQSDSADVRLKAAEGLHSPEVMERVYQAVRNSDRRVAKLLQGRLKDLAQQAQQQEQAEACISKAQQMLAKSNLAASQLVDLDHAWQALGVTDEALISAFTTARTAVAERLKAQVELQRSLQQALNDLRALLSCELSSPEVIVTKLEALATKVAEYAAAPEADSLPKQLLEQFNQEYAQCQKTLNELQKRFAATTEREAILVTWENAELSALKAETLKRKWPTLPGEAIEPLQARFDALLERVYAEQKAQGKEVVAPVSNQEAQRVFGEALDALEQALQEGLLQAASKQDKTLRSIDSKTAKATADQLSRLSNARNELTRLQDWAKWGGNVSREELIKVVEELPAEELAFAELAKKVGSSRERWKFLDSTSGPAPKPLWERFDLACTTAYAPVAEHYKKLADERQQNHVLAQALITETTEFAAATLPEGVNLDAVDWKALAAFCRRVNQAWKRLGITDRKEKKRLDAEFETAVQSLLKPLEQQQQVQIAQREKLIAEVSKLSPTDRGAVDALRAVQARWQELAKAMPLERNDEQALWTRFREASDALFAQRKASAEAADQERQHNKTLKEEHCASLEAALGEANNHIAQLLRESPAIWKGIGAVPRAVEAEIEQRYQTAVSALQAQVDESKRAAKTAQRNALRDKLRLCQQAESAFAANKKFDASLQAAWDQLPALSAEDEKAMRARFAAILSAWSDNDPRYLAALEQNREALLSGLLRQEIVAGIDSPAELAAERLTLQVDVLKATLKSGQKPASEQAQLLALCSLPAFTDAATVLRLEKLI